MLLTISTTHNPATDLGYLLHKNPARLQSEEISFGTAYVFYPEATAQLCTVALLVEIDPIGLIRGRRGPAGEAGQLQQYVNDRPYTANSFLSVAIGEMFSTAMSGRSKERQELAETSIPLIASLPVVASRGGVGLIEKLFGPLGYSVKATGSVLDEKFPEWGASAYFSVEIAATARLQDLLAHLYVLIPVLDNEKHYWVGEDEIQKLLNRGEGWLAKHPEKDLIVSRYLKRQRHLTREALERLSEDELEGDEPQETVRDEEEQKVERPLGLHEQRLGTVLSVLRGIGAKRVVDLGCGEGKLLRSLLADPQFESILGMDVSWRSIEIAKERLRIDQLPERQRSRIGLIQGSLMYRDERIGGFDAAAVVEVIEHLDAPRLSAFERVLFEFARPATAIITTPNCEYNPLFETLPAGRFRHRDHRFEWTRAEFEQWGSSMASRFGYQVRFQPIGPEDAAPGAPTQMGVFRVDEKAAIAVQLVVPIGTQVVLRAETVICEPDQIHMKGQVAEIIQNPGGALRSYRVRFADGTEATVLRDGFSVLKQMKAGPLLEAAAAFSERDLDQFIRSARNLSAASASSVVAVWCAGAVGKSCIGGVLLGVEEVYRPRSQGESEHSGVSLHTPCGAKFGDRRCAASVLSH